MIFRILLFLLIPLFSTAQVNIGIKAGLNLAGTKSVNETKTQGQSQSRIVGLNAGFYADFHLDGQCYIQPELLFRNGGYKTKLSNQYRTEENKYRLYYIDIPVLFKYRLIGAQPGSFFIMAGPYVGFMVDGKYSRKLQDEKFEVEDKYFATNLRTLAEAGGILSIGKEIRTKAGLFSVEIRITKALTNSRQHYIYNNYRQYNNAIGFQIGYILGYEEFFGPRR